MKTKMKAVFLCFILSLNEPVLATSGKLLLLMIDGLKHDYVTDDLDGFKAVTDQGVKAEYLKPQFPSVTLTNWMSMLTGLYPEGHGLINNYIYDRNASKQLNPSNPNELDWVSGVPLYRNYYSQGKTSQWYYWLDCNIPPMSYCQERDFGIGVGVSLERFNSSIYHAIHSMRNGSTNLTGLYFERIDAFGHFYGPKSPEVRENMINLDKVISSVVQELNTPNNDINLVIISDHGMVDVTPNRSVEITAHMNQSEIEIWLTSPPITFVFPKDGYVEKTYEKLSKMHPNVTAYLKDDIPVRWHLANHHRVPPITLVADLGWSMYSNPAGYPYHDNHQYSFFGAGKPLLGYHGYDNIHPDMWGSFMAMGPDFKKGYTQPGFSNENVYLILCNILGIKPTANNATWSQVSDMFTPEVQSTTPPISASVQIVPTSISVLLTMSGLLFSNIYL